MSLYGILLNIHYLRNHVRSVYFLQTYMNKESSPVLFQLNTGGEGGGGASIDVPIDKIYYYFISVIDIK